MNHQHRTHRPLRNRRLVTLTMPFLLVGAVSLTACGDDTADIAEAADLPATADTTPTTHSTDTTHSHPPVTVDAPPTTEVTEPTTAAAPEPGVVTITATDYTFQNVPPSIPMGSRLVIENLSAAELHEIVAFRLPDAETRPVGELMMLPQQELTAALGGAPRAVLLQAPGSGDTINAVGDGTLGEPGRYVILCGIPIGADPGEYLTAAAASPGGPPQGVAGGPPHLVAGMFAEFVVE